MYLSDKQLAERFSVTRPTVWRWHRTDNSFPRAVNLSPGCTRWRQSDIEAWEVAQARTTKAAPARDGKAA
jgi:predicted DNA-binding transcriptional regulator AlpA